ncbi:hypothetical protein GCM10007962_21710 [Yeosuana aromativorans]|uniref:Uncharacterized protein n=1 Tax=Yeosuana aromativorans TaxID=288019 RepID=A0A8J3FHS3_9FLAO|nr:hypothetical protein [Yeosuana aromativorans]GGK27105.1 hypothetical protein GCM10007962_21710 [Yeosuana aromativorans]
MPFGESFQSTIKSNKSIMLDNKSRRFVKTQGGFDSSKKNQFDFKEATPEQLMLIKKRIQRQNIKIRITLIIAFVVLFIVLFFILNLLTN